MNIQTDRALAFLYDSRKARLLEEVGEIAIPPKDLAHVKLPGVTLRFDGFDRNPYLAAFQIGHPHTTGVPLEVVVGSWLKSYLQTGGADAACHADALATVEQQEGRGGSCAGRTESAASQRRGRILRSAPERPRPNLKDLLRTVEEVRKKLHPHIDPSAVEAVLPAEEQKTEVDAEAGRALQTALAAKGGSQRECS